MSMRFVDYAAQYIASGGEYVSVTYWRGDLNVWRVVERDDTTGALRIENVSDWRGLTHTGVSADQTSRVDREHALSAMRTGLQRAKSDHPNAMRRTAAARREGAEDGKAAGSWAIDGNTSADAARAILAALDDGTYWDQVDVEYPQKTYAHADHVDDTEKWDAYVSAYDDAYSAEVERAARYVIGDDAEDETER